MHDGIRKELLDKELIPAYHRIKQWLNVIKTDYGKGSQGQAMVEQYLDDYYRRIVLRKNKDENDKFDPLFRNITNAFSFLALGYKPTGWMRSAYYNAQTTMLESLAESAITTKVSDIDAKTLNIPTASDMAKANALIFTDYAKIYRLGKKFSIINSSEMDAIESIFTTMADKHAGRNQIAQIGNYYSDMLSRLVSMAAFMIHDGSYDAHTFNKETNELFYDVTKDKRFYDKGEWIGDREHTMFNDLYKSLVRDNLVKDNKMQVGYDFRDANTRFKWYTDKFIIGSMDEYQKTLMGQTALGAMAMQFRNFLPDKVFNLIGPNMLTSYGAVRDIRVNADNVEEVYRKQVEMEGSVISVLQYFNDVLKVIRYKDMTLKELNESLSPIRRHNLAKEVLRATFITTIVLGLYAAVKAGMTDRDRDKLEFLWSELASWRVVTDFKEVFPISRVLNDIWALMSGNYAWQKMLLRYTGPANDTIWYFELFTENDTMLYTAKEQKKKKDMDEKELLEYETKRLRSKEAKRRNDATKEMLGIEE